MSMTREALYNFVHDMIPSDTEPATHELTERLITRALMLVVSGQNENTPEMVSALLSAALLNHRMATTDPEVPSPCQCGMLEIGEDGLIRADGMVHYFDNHKCAFPKLAEVPAPHTLTDVDVEAMRNIDQKTQKVAKMICSCGAVILENLSELHDGIVHTTYGPCSVETTGPVSCTCGLVALYEGVNVLSHEGIAHRRDFPCCIDESSCKCGKVPLTVGDKPYEIAEERHTKDWCGFMPTEEQIVKCACTRYNVSDVSPFYKDGVKHTYTVCMPHSGTLNEVRG